jgi:hypothetical protein
MERLVTTADFGFKAPARADRLVGIDREATVDGGVANIAE